MSIVAGHVTPLYFELNATELAAGTPFDIVSPVDGWIEDMRIVVQTAIVTGGAITVKIGTTDVTGLSITVADAATKGTTQFDAADLGTATRKVAKGDRIQVIPAAAFNGGGAINGFISVRNTQDLSPAAPW